MSYTKEMSEEAPRFVERATELLIESGFSIEKARRSPDPLYISSHTGPVYRKIMVEFGISAQRANTAVGRSVRKLRHEERKK